MDFAKNQAQNLQLAHNQQLALVVLVDLVALVAHHPNHLPNPNHLAHPNPNHLAHHHPDY